MNKIMINGRACSGKDKVADYLVKEYGYKKIAFATPIYQICYDYFGMTNKDRTLLQAVGEAMRAIDPDVWVRVAYKESERYNRVVISDIRRENEYLYGLQHGFVPLRVHSDLETRISRSIQRDGAYPNLDEWENESEVGADNFKYHELSNNGSLDELYRLIDYVLTKGVKD